jgi:MoxR-like ATPase
MGLYWINPRKFLPSDNKTTAYGKSKGITAEPEDYRTYRQWLKEMTERVGDNYPEVSHQAHLLAIQPPKLDLSSARMEELWSRFNQAFPGFTDFESPGEAFVANETGYKRALLKKFERELGAQKLSALVTEGRGIDAANEIRRVLTSNIVSFHAWNGTLGKTDQAACDVVRECLKVTAAAYEGPETTRALFEAFGRHKLKPAWDALTVLLWALRPQDYFPVKISYYRKLSAELEHELPSGRPDPDKLHSLIEFGRAFWNALEPRKPGDWVDVQSFIWVVCPSEGEDPIPGEPFDCVFDSLNDARAAFDLVRWTLDTLGVAPEQYESDTRIALTLPQNQKPALIRLNFGNWPVLAFFGPSQGGGRVHVLCQKSLVEGTGAPISGRLAESIDDESFTTISVKLRSVSDEGSPERTAFHESLLKARTRFDAWHGSPYRIHHRTDLLRMAYDEAERERCLRKGLAATPPPPTPPLPPSGTPRYWWLNANPKIWDFEETAVGAKQTYTSHNQKGNRRQKYRCFQEVQPGDLVIGYVTSPQREVVAVCKITKGLHQTVDGREEIEFEKIEQLATPIPYETLRGNPDLANCEPLVNNQGSLFKLTELEFEIIRSLIDDTNVAVTVRIERYDKRKAMAGLFLAESQFDEMLTALTEKKNVVLQGAPGVGKTFVARRLAYALIGSNDPRRIEMIQFHQSYSYEDFIQGFRPTPQGHFGLKYGIFHQFCRRAQRDEGEPHVFIIDEINRGNLSKIFGELMMLIEPDKRGSEHAIPLAYAQDADERFYIPENVHLIGMMNTADRSLAMVDYALRRRFRFITLRPEFASPAFETFLIGTGAKPELVKRIVSRMNALNDVIAADTRNLGPGYQIGHSYFCPRNGIKPVDEWYRRVIESEIVPLIQEYWFDNEQKVNEQRLTLLA